MSKTALVFGATGQDGSYLCEMLLRKGYDVLAIARRSSVDNTNRLEKCLKHKRFTMVRGDICDQSFVFSTIAESNPAEIYNLAAQSHVGDSFTQPNYTIDVDLMGTLNVLNGILNFSKSSRFYQASTSEMYGSCFSYFSPIDGTRVESKTAISREDFIDKNCFQDELTAMIPNSPYGVAKLASHNLVKIYRESYGLYACSGILFNHESPRRGELFVTRKITSWIGRYKNGKTKEKLQLGNIDSLRDWGHAKDYVEAMYLMLQLNSPHDFVVSTGCTYSVEDFLNSAFKHADLGNWKKHVALNPTLKRPFEVDALRGISKKAVKALKWKPGYNFDLLVKEMVESDIDGHKV
jgi:GDPmannose 4,6-dehydratase